MKGLSPDIRYCTSVCAHVVYDSPSSVHRRCAVLSLESTVCLAVVTGCMAGFCIAC